MIYLNKELVLYSPLDLEFDQNLALAEGRSMIEKYGAWISSKGIKLNRPNIDQLSKQDADIKERKSRQKQRDKRPNDFPVKGVLLRGIHGLKYSFSYLITDTKVFEWTDIIQECPTLYNLINNLPFERLGRVNIQTVEAGMSLHKHVDSVFRIDSDTTTRREEHLRQYNITDFNMDVNCFITIVLQGNGIDFYFNRTKEKVTMFDNVYYFCPHLIHHGISESNKQRIICRIEGKASKEMVDLIQNNAIRNNDRVLTL